MPLGLGIDTGGTYTDAVLVDLETKKVYASAKTLTTRPDLSSGIQRAVELLGEQKAGKISLREIDMVGLSTTLATNAIVENYRSKVCLLLIGYDRDVISEYGLIQKFNSEHIVFIPGGIDLQGNESCNLDEEAVERAVGKNRNLVEAFAISCFFGSRNPSQEIRAREIVKKMCDLPVTCGHELTSRLDSVLRAQTVATNAALISLLHDLMISVRKTLDGFGIQAPLLVVKGDGSLMKAELAVQRPVETILSGPAASIMGAWRLSGEKDAWIVDMGGTTTDIGKIADGHVEINREGATVAGRKTMVQAADIYTIGLGGDSHVRAERRKPMEIGPKRVIPLCRLADLSPTIINVLHYQNQAHGGHPLAGQFAVFRQNPKQMLAEEDQALLEKTKAGPVPMLIPGKEGLISARRFDSLEDKGLIQLSAFTPTDALHTLGLLGLWNTEASRIGGEMLAKRIHLSIKSFGEKVIGMVCTGIAKAILTKIIRDAQGPPDWDKEKTADFFVDNALKNEIQPEIRCAFTLERPLIGIGAPAECFLPKVSEMLNCRLIRVPHAQVANAVGAVAGAVTQRRTILITPIGDGARFRVHLPDGIRDFKNLEEAARFAQSHFTALLKTSCQEAGAEKVTIQTKRTDRIIEGIHLDTELEFIAAGRPKILS